MRPAERELPNVGGETITEHEKGFTGILAWEIFLRKWDLLINEECEINQASTSG